MGDTGEESRGGGRGQNRQKVHKGREQAPVVKSTLGTQHTLPPPTCSPGIMAKCFGHSLRECTRN